jgi:hypothetical protein
MSVIESKLDAKEMAKGKDAKKGKAKEEKKEEADKPLSKKELNKLKRKENAAKAKAAKTGDEEGSAAPASLEPKPIHFNTIRADLTKDLAFLESKLKVYAYLGGDSPSKLDAEYLEKVKPHQAILSPLSHPNAFGWYSLCAKYSDKVTAKWS